MLKLKTQLDIVKYSLYVKKKFSARWRPGGVGPPSVNFGPPNISESTRAEKVETKITVRYIKVLALSTHVFFPLGGVLGVQNPLSEL